VTRSAMTATWTGSLMALTRLEGPEGEFFVEPDFVDDLPEAGGEGFTAKDAFFIGSIAGQAYEESQDERRRRLINKKDKD